MTDSQDLQRDAQQDLQQENEALRQRVAVLEGRLVQAGEGMVRLLSVLENSLDAAYRRNLRTDSYDYMSPVIEQITGWSADEMCSMDTQTVLECIHPEDLSTVQRVIEATQAECGAVDRAIATLEYRFRGKDGAYRWLADNITVLAGEDGEPLYRLGSVRDISQRKQAEVQLRESEERFRSLFDNMLDGFAYCQMLYENGGPVDFIYLAVNQAFEKLTGLKDVVGKRVSQVIPGIQQDNPEVIEIYGQVAAGGAPQRFETYVPLLDLWLSISVYSSETGYFVVVFDNITQRKRAEEKLRFSEQRFRNFFELGSVGMTITSLEKGWLECNDRLCEMLGYTRQELQSLTWAQLTHPDDLAADVAYFNRVLAGEIDGYTVDKRFIRKDGSVMDTSLSVHSLRRPSGEVEHFAGVLQDITQRKRAEQELERFFNLVPDMVCIASADGYFKKLNREWERVLGYTAEELLSRPLADFIHPDDREATFKEIERQLGGGATIAFVNRYRAKDGSYRWFEWNATPAVDQTLLFAAARDITGRREAEEQLARANERLELATRSARLGIWDWDIQKNELAWDEGMYRLYGLQPGQFGGAYEAWLHGVHPEDREASDRLSEQVRRGDGVYDTEFRVVWPDGSVHWLKADGQVYRDAAGSAVRMIGVNADLTPRKRMEQELRRALDELRSSNADLEEFAYAASHDLQEPLRVVSGMLQLLQQRYGGCLDDRADEYIRHAVDASERMQALIRDLLQYSRLGRRSLALVSFPLQQALDAALANLRVSVEEAGAQVTQDELPIVRADQTQVIQLLQNLVSNSLKFHGVRPPQIHIGALRLANGWRFSVSDNGIGIEPQYYERIFQVFQRLHTRSEYPGTGIGLALCKKIVERHGGRIWVESQVGQGSSFYFTLPAEG